MKIENGDALKQWLISVLQPIFDGDPDKLASYILALAKKVENDQASRDRCIKDLQVFLETNTNNFVDSLFETLNNKKYLTQTQPPQNENKTDDLTNRKKDHHDSSSRYQNDRERDRSRRFTNYDDSRRNNQRHSADHYSNRSANSYRGRLSRDYQEIDSARNRSRSRSSKTRHKNRNRTHRGASSSSSSSSSSPSVNASSSRRFDGERKNAYKRSYTRSRSFSPRNRLNINNEEKKQRCRDFDEKGFCTQAELCPFDHGEVVIAPLMSSNGANTTTQPLIPNIEQDLNAPNPIIAQNTFPMNNQMYNQNDMNQGNRFNNRNNNNNQQRRNQQNKPTSGGLLPMPHNFQVQQQGRFNNQRNNQVTANNNAPQSQALISGNQNDLFNLQQQQQQRQIMSNRPRNLVNIVTSMNQEEQMNESNQQIGFNPQQQQQPHQRGMKRGYYNNNNSNFNNLNSQQNFGQNSEQNFNYQQPNTQFNQQQMPALLPTPLPLQQQQTANQPVLNKVPGFNQANNLANQNNTTLILRKVPLDLNRVDKMRQHFSKFGQIVDIQCQYENNQDATMIQFANNQQALAAYKSPQSVFNNRFIRIFWLSNYQKHQSLHPQQQQQQANNQTNDEPVFKKTVKDRLSFINNFDEQSDLHSEIKNKENKKEGSTSETMDQSPNKPDTETTSQEPAQNSQNLTNNFSTLNINKTLNFDTKKINYENAAKQIQDENQKKVLMLKLEVKQKARELIEKQIKDQKLLLQKYEQAKTKEEKNQILSLVKQLSLSIEKEKEILSNKTFDVSATSPSVYNTSPFTFQKVPQAQKNLIIPPPVHHLKLNNKRLNNTNFLKSQAQAAAAATAPIKSSPKLSMQPVAMQTQFSYSRVDNRPKQLLITGVENLQEKTNLINFVRAFGCQIENINDLSNDEPNVSFQINFVTRKDAEIALAKSSAALNGKAISITWSKSETTETKLAVKEVIEELCNEEIKTEDKMTSEDDDSKSKDTIKPLDTNESTNQSAELDNKEFVDALFDDNTNYESILS